MRTTLARHPKLYLHTCCWNRINSQHPLYEKVRITLTAFTYSSIALHPVRVDCTGADDITKTCQKNTSSDRDPKLESPNTNQRLYQPDRDVRYNSGNQRTPCSSLCVSPVPSIPRSADTGFVLFSQQSDWRRTGVVFTVVSIKCCFLLSDKHNYTDLVYLVFIQYYMFRLSTSAIIR
jgi:hypothetical protein